MSDAIEAFRAQTGASDANIADLTTFLAMLTEANEVMNLVGPDTLPDFWNRHAWDSAQLLDRAPEAKTWADLGAGAGFPGIVIAALAPDRPVHLVESRALRCDFLSRVATDLGLANVIVHHDKLERVAAFDSAIISARAFAPLPKLLDLAGRFATKRTIWVLPKGKNAVNELASLPKSWQRLFHVEQSLTDADSHILVGHGKAQ